MKAGLGRVSMVAAADAARTAVVGDAAGSLWRARSFSKPEASAQGAASWPRPARPWVGAGRLAWASTRRPGVRALAGASSRPCRSSRWSSLRARACPSEALPGLLKRGREGDGARAGPGDLEALAALPEGAARATAFALLVAVAAVKPLGTIVGALAAADRSCRVPEAETSAGLLASLGGALAHGEAPTAGRSRKDAGVALRPSLPVEADRRPVPVTEAPMVCAALTTGRVSDWFRRC